MRKIVLTGIIALTMTLGVSNAWSEEGHEGDCSMAKGSEPMCEHMPGMMGRHMGKMKHRMGGMGGGCPMMEPGVAVKVEKTKNGATITLTSDDPKQVRRIQTRAEIMRLVHELRSEETAESE